MARRKIAVFAPAPIAVGEEIEVHLATTPNGQSVAVRDLRTGILYGSGGMFSEADKEDVIEGERSHYRTSRPHQFSRVESVFRGRVVECVIANVSRREGHAPCTSFIIEDATPPGAPYRT